MSRQFRPIFMYPCTFSRKGAVFLTPRGEVIVNAPKKLLEQLLVACDGDSTLETVCNHLGASWNKETLSDFVKSLVKSGVICDSSSILRNLWGLLKNPARFPSSLTQAQVGEHTDKAQERCVKSIATTHHPISNTPAQILLKKRRSTRHFTSETVRLQDVVDMLWSGYGQVEFVEENLRRTVPSAGALSPLNITLVSLGGIEEMVPGVFDIDFSIPNKVGFRERAGASHSRAVQSFMDPLILENAAGVVVISALVELSEAKYGNRSVLYVPLEAGHVAQNIHHTAQEKGIGSVEIGGFIDSHLADALGKSDEEMIVTIVFGKKGSQKEACDVTVDWVCPYTEAYRVPFSIAMARVSEEINDDWSYGRDVSPYLARAKAVSEAKEWAAAGCVPNDLVQANANEIGTFIHPDDIIRFSLSQYEEKGFPFARFDGGTRYGWVTSENILNGERAFILADLVYFPYYPDTKLCAYANSSGVAAHTEHVIAEQKAVLELIERDSFMTAYLTRLQLPRVNKVTLPDRMKMRLQSLHEAGFEITIVDGSLEYAPVVFVFAQSDALGYFTCSAASDFEVENALDRALMETEASVLARLQNGPSKKITPKAVAMPADHGAIYEQKKYYRKADFMLTGSRTIGFGEIGLGTQKDWNSLLAKLGSDFSGVYMVPLSVSDRYSGNEGRHIVRAIVPGLVPMTFGYRQEPLGMQRIYEVAKRFGSNTTGPRTANRFPHPFA